MASAFDSATISGLSVEPMAVGFKFAAHESVGLAGILAGAVDQMQQHVATLGVAEETVAQAGALMRALDQPGQIGEHEFALVDAHDAELRVQRGERIAGDLRLGGADRGQEGGLAGIGQADDAGVGDQFEAQPDDALDRRLARIGVARRAVGRRLEARVAEAAIAAGEDDDALADRGEIGDQRLAVLLIDLRAGRDLEHRVLAVGAVPVLAHAVAAGFGLEVLLVAVVDQRVEPVDRLDHDVAAFAAVAAARPAELDELLAPERHAAVTARAGLDVDLGFVEEFHACLIHGLSSPAKAGDPVITGRAGITGCPAFAGHDRLVNAELR